MIALRQTTNSKQFTGVLVALGAMAAGVAISSVEGITLRQIAVATNAALVVFPFALGKLRRNFDIFEPVYLFAAVFAVFFLIRPLFDLTSTDGIPPLLGRETETHYTKALLLSNLGGIGFYLGYYSYLGRHLGKSIPAFSGHWYEANMRLTVTVVATMSLAFTFLFIRSAGGPGRFLYFATGRSRDRALYLRETSGYIYSSPLWLAGIGLLLYSMSGPKTRGRLYIGLGLCGLSQVMTIGGGGRSTFIPLILSLAVIRYLKAGRRPSLTLVVLLIVPFLIVGVSFPRQYRSVETRSGSFSKSFVRAVIHPNDGLRETFEGLDTAMIGLFAQEVSIVPQVTGYKYGRTLLDSALRPIPRAIFPSKPRSGDEQIMQILWPGTHVDYYFSIFGDPYFNWGAPGVFGFMAIFGVAWRSVFVWFKKNDADPVTIAIYAANFPFILVYLRGGVGADYQRQVLAVAPIVLVALLSARRRLGVRMNGDDSRPYGEGGQPIAIRAGVGSSMRIPAEELHHFEAQSEVR